ncbi:MAG: TetR-like C-terminal domain-containing protein, partial [Candidatus Dormibacteria bacterium]
EGVCRSAAITGSAGRRDLGVMQGLVSAMAHDPALARVFLRRFVAPRRAALAQVFTRAVERGEMAPGKDIDLLTSVIPALMMHRLVTSHQLPGRQFAARIIEGLLLPAATAAPAARLPEEPAPLSHPLPPPGPQQQGDTSSALRSGGRQNLGR